MNKYFLSLMSILILFQSFKVLDEIFFHEVNDNKKGYVVIEEKEENKKVEITENKSNSEVIDLDQLFTNASIEKGTKIARQCSACHDFSTNLKIKVGPPLWGVVGRKVGVISDFKYSDALNSYKKNWTRSELNGFLENPKNYINGTKMIYKGLNKINDRVNLIYYLESLK